MDLHAASWTCVRDTSRAKFCAKICPTWQWVDWLRSAHNMADRHARCNGHACVRKQEVTRRGPNVLGLPFASPPRRRAMAGQRRGCPPATTHLLCASGIRGQRQDGLSLYNGGSPGVCSTPSTWCRTSGGGARGRPQTYPSPDRRYGAARGVDRARFAHRCMQTKWNNHAYRGAGLRPRLQDGHTKLLLSDVMYAPLQ